MDIAAYNRRAWDREVEDGNIWTLPVDGETIARARRGDWRIVLTPAKPVPSQWFPSLSGCRVLCLASGGGQQGPVLAAAGAEVTVFDNSPEQLSRDREVAGREGLALRTELGDMRDLSRFPDGSFDLIVHPVSNCFVDDVRPVWREAARVLGRGGLLLAGFENPLTYIFDMQAWNEDQFKVRHRIPYSDLQALTEEELREHILERDEPLCFGHSLEDQIQGQIDAGFCITGFYEDDSGGEGPLDRYINTFIATRAVKTGAL